MYSVSFDKYYISQTNNIEKRLQQHNNGHESNEDDQLKLPRIKWPSTSNNNDSSSKDEDNNTSDPVKLLEQIQSRYPNTPPQ